MVDVKDSTTDIHIALKCAALLQTYGPLNANTRRERVSQHLLTYERRER